MPLPVEHIRPKHHYGLIYCIGGITTGPNPRGRSSRATFYGQQRKIPDLTYFTMNNRNFCALLQTSGAWVSLNAEWRAISSRNQYATKHHFWLRFRYSEKEFCSSTKHQLKQKPKRTRATCTWLQEVSAAAAAAVVTYLQQLHQQSRLSTVQRY